MCSWANTQSMKADKLDWELTSQEADKHYSTPLSDHTLGTEKGKQEWSSKKRVVLKHDMVIHTLNGFTKADVPL